MTRIESLIDQIVDMVQRWLKDFDEKPWRTGAKVLVGILVIRLAYRILARTK